MNQCSTRWHRTSHILCICKKTKYVTVRAPMLLVTVVGCHFLQGFGAAWNGGMVCHDPLCSPVSLLFVPCDPNHAVSKPAHVLAALHSTVEKLKEYYSHPLMERTILNKGPYFNLNGLEYKKQMEVKWLFEAQFNGEDVVVKFFRSHYGTDVHVHGDLRVQNILVVDDSISILDFDWVGKEGEVRYPQELNTSCDWYSDVKPGGIIAKEHDVYHINTICGP